MSYYKNIPSNVKEGDRFLVKYDTDMDGNQIDFSDHYDKIKMGDILELKRNDGSTCPLFWLPDKSDDYYFDWGIFEPLSVSLSKLQVGDVIQFVDDNGNVCIKSVRDISEHRGLKESDPLYKFTNANGSYDIPVNKGTIVAIEGDYAMVTWKCDESRIPCVRFHIKNLKLKNRNDDVQTVIGTRSQKCTGGESGISSSGVELTITGGRISYTEIHCTIGATCETSQICRTISIL